MQCTQIQYVTIPVYQYTSIPVSSYPHAQSYNSTRTHNSNSHNSHNSQTRQATRRGPSRAGDTLCGPLYCTQETCTTKDPSLHAIRLDADPVLGKRRSRTGSLLSLLLAPLSQNQCSAPYTRLLLALPALRSHGSRFPA